MGAMHSWLAPSYQPIAGNPVPLQLYDTADQKIRPLTITGNTAGMYVCGITPYDAPHLGHAATYVTFDLIYRTLLDNGHQVHYVQNVTDVDDPLFERAQRDSVDWRQLGSSQIDLFRSDMQALSIFPPQEYVGAMEAVDEVIDMIHALLDTGAAYIVDDPTYPDIYASVSATDSFGYESNYCLADMHQLFAERGGDPTRPGKHHPLDALLWRAHREGEPSWPSPFGPGRPGWHIECSAIATNRLGPTFTIQGGGKDLIFPHHEFSAAHAEAAHGCHRMADFYVHTGMIGLEGVKMSKSLGNLVFVHQLIHAGHEPSAIRLGIYSGHYREDRDWSDTVLNHATHRLSHWRQALHTPGTLAQAQELINTLRTHIANDLNTPAALAALDDWADTPHPRNDTGANILIRNALDSLLGIQLS